MGTQPYHSFGIQLAGQDVSCIVKAIHIANGDWFVRSGSERELGAITLQELSMNLDLPTGQIFATLLGVGRVFTNGQFELDGHHALYCFSLTTSFVSVKRDQETLLTATSHDLSKIPHLSAAVAALMTAELLFMI